MHQAGMLSIFFSSNHNLVRQVYVSSADVTMTGFRPFEWFGASVSAIPMPQSNGILLLVGAPASWKNPEKQPMTMHDSTADSLVPGIHKEDQQGHTESDLAKEEAKEGEESVVSGSGRVYAFHVQNGQPDADPIFSIVGPLGRMRVGHAVAAYQDPKNPESSFVAISSPSFSGGFLKSGAGAVVVVDITKLLQQVSLNRTEVEFGESSIPGTVLFVKGDAALGRMGYSLWLGDADGNGEVDMVIGQPFTETEKGSIHYYPNFRHSNVQRWTAKGSDKSIRFGESFSLVQQEKPYLLVASPRSSHSVNGDKLIMAGAIHIYEL